MPLTTAILVMGPTASGKSTLALALAQRFPAEIVSVDSAQVFRDMDVGTAKPDAITRAAVPHHLIDIVSPEQSYSAGAFQQDASRLVGEISARGRLPLLVGGTMLYFKALREGLAELPGADAGVRREIDAEAARRGWPALHAELARLDPATAARLAPNDAQRIQRALEIVRLTGKPLDESRTRTRQPPLAARCLAIALMPADRARLHERIARRFDAMLAAGLIDEVTRLRKRYRLDPRTPSMRCVGYRQVWSYLEGEFSRTALREKAIAATRQLAKRQLTWLRATPGAQMFDCLAPDLPGRVLDYLRTRVG